jgi:hypothetical protein
MLLVQLGINSTRDVWKSAKLDSPRRLVQFWQNFQTSPVLLIPNCIRHRMITYTYPNPPCQLSLWEEKTHDFRQNVDRLFSHESVVRIEPTISEVKGACSDYNATEAPFPGILKNPDQLVIT